MASVLVCQQRHITYNRTVAADVLAHKDVALDESQHVHLLRECKVLVDGIGPPLAGCYSSAMVGVDIVVMDP